MRHDYYLEGARFSLRPVGDQDIEAIIALRSDPERTRFLPPISGLYKEQQDWLQSYYQRTGDYYFAVISSDKINDEPYGFTSIYDVEISRGLAQWGRLILKRGSGALLETTLLSYQFVFETLGLREMYVRTIINNSRLVNFYDQWGLKRYAVLAEAFTIKGLSCDAVEYRLSVADWPKVKAYLNSKITG